MWNDSDSAISRVREIVDTVVCHVRRRIHVE